jgi:ketosteroid isomerase-like protein
MQRARILLAAVTVFALPCLVAAQAADQKHGASGKEEQEVEKFEREWSEAYKQHDKATLERILADGFVFTDPQGKVHNKAQYIDLALHEEILSYTLSDLAVHVHGDTGIVTGVWHAKYMVDGKEQSGTLYFTDVVVKRAGRWQVVASHDAQAKE